MKVVSFNSATNKSKFEIICINLIILTYLFRTAIPLLKYPFIALYAFFLSYTIILYHKDLLITLRTFVKEYYILIILTLILIFSFYFSSKIYLLVFKDVINTLILLSILFLLTLFINTKNTFSYFNTNFPLLTLILAAFVSLMVLLDTFGIISYRDLTQITHIDALNNGIPSYLDWNFSLIPSYFGVIAALAIFRIQTKKNNSRVIFLLFALFSCNIYLSGSRRGIILLGLIVIVLVGIKVYNFLSNKDTYKKLDGATNSFLLSLIIVFALLISFLLIPSYELKNKALEIIQSKDIKSVKTTLAFKLYRYYSPLKSDISFSDFYKRVWSESFDPKDPESGWGTGSDHKTIFPLTGNNVNIVPPGSSGYMIDSSCRVAYYEGVNLSESYTFLFDTYAKLNDSFKASAYCFVSENCDIDFAGIGLPQVQINSGRVSGILHSAYDLKNKGNWQKLEIDFKCSDGNVSVVMSIIKNNAKDFSNINGYIIFAYPIYERNGVSILEYEKSTFGKRDAVAVAPLISNKQEVSTATLMSLDLVTKLGQIQGDPDPIRKFIAKLISEDTTYYPYNSKIVLDTINNSFLKERLERWEFAIEIFSKEYNIQEKFLGKGFSFLNWYGKFFYMNKNKTDYPHNPFLSVLLYSGLVGLFFYIVLVCKAFQYYLKLLKVVPTLAVFFLITFFFSFFSAGSPFDPPIMGFFVILPFFLNHIHKKENLTAVNE